MDFNQLLILQIIAHILADFYLQTDVWARHKKMYGHHSKIMYYHTLIVFVLSYLFSFQIKFVFASLIIFAVHLATDLCKKYIEQIKIRRTPVFKTISFQMDQVFHLATIYVVVYWFTEYQNPEPLFRIPLSANQLLVVLGYLICLKPTNVFIKEIFKMYRIKLPKTKDDLMNAGKLIGNIERVLTLTLLLTGKFEAIGFIIAGKSILRYEGKKTGKTEYVLIGTFLSFGIAILVGIVITQLK